MSSHPLPALPMETWTVVNDGKHNAFTDLLYWRGEFWLAYISSPSHFASRHSRVVLLRSTDAKQWQQAAQFSGNGEDIRDPKLGIIHGRLFLFALLNKKFDAEPYKSIATYSADGSKWSDFEDVTPDGWLLGRPVSRDDQTYFAPAHRIDHGSAVLLHSTNGIAWDIHAPIQTGDRADETAVQLLSNGLMISASRVEAGGGIFGHPEAGTQISSAQAPFSEWTSLTRSNVTRLDGPVLFTHNDHLFAVGRRQVRAAGQLRWQGSAIGQKRSALFLIRKKDGELIHLTDLPSSGDTSYPGAVIVNEKLFISYYTNDPGRDPAWLIGMLLPTQIRIAMIETSHLIEVEK